MSIQAANPSLSYAAPAPRARHGALGAVGLGLALFQLVIVAAGYYYVWRSLGAGNIRMTMTLNWQMFAFAAVALLLCFVELSREGPRKRVLPVAGLCAALASVVAAVVLGSVTWGAN